MKKGKSPLVNPYRKRGGIKPTSTEEAQNRMNGEPLEKGDLPAMIIAAFITFLPALVLLIGLVLLIVYGFFLR